MSPVLLTERYELGEMIGRGGMADVHAAFDRRLKREVAIKIMKPGTGGADDVESRFEDEARVAARLQHPNVVAVFDTGATEDGCPFIVMERLPGETLADRMRTGQLPDSVVRVVADDVLAAMASAHAAGIVHRDIKPGNILLTDDGRAKIADFGIARESDTLLVDPTTVNALTGTPAYLAPERVEGKPATARSDIWALGVVLYEALAGRKPFDGASPLAVAMAVRDGDVEPLEKFRPDVDPGLAAVVRQAMAHDPAQRFASAGEMAAAMNGDATATIADRTVLLTSGPGLAAARFDPRRIALAGAALAAVLLLIAIGLAAGRAGNDAPSATTTPVTTQVPSTAPTTTVAPTSAPALIDDDEAPTTERRRDGKGRRGDGD